MTSHEPKTPVATSQIRVFVSYDREHDEDLVERFVAETDGAMHGFEVLGRSRAASGADPTDTRLRRELDEVDEMVVLCGEHSGECERMSTELAIAQEAGLPYVLVWGRREKMCTKPRSAKNGDAIFGWTRDTVREQIAMLRRAARSSDLLAAHRRAKVESTGGG